MKDEKSIIVLLPKYFDILRVTAAPITPETPIRKVPFLAALSADKPSIPEVKISFEWNIMAFTPES